MKRSFTLLVVISFAFIAKVFSQDNNFTNDTVSFWVDNIDELKEYKPIIKNVKSSSVTLKMKKVILSGISGAENTLCWAGICDPSFGNVIVGSQKVLAAGASSSVGDMVLDFNSKGNTGVSEILYVIFNKDNPNDSVYFKVRYRSVPGGVPGYTISGTPFIDFNTTTGVKDVENNTLYFNATPNPSDENTVIKYSLKSNHNSRIILRNVLGTLVSETKLTKAEGEVELNTKSLEAGVYFYSIVDDEKISLTKKLVIAR